MRNLLIINVAANKGSTGRIAEGIARLSIENGYNSYLAYSRSGNESCANLIKIGDNFDVKLHGLESLLFDNHGFASRCVTRKFISEIERIKPDIINLHNIHGYYINVDILFNYLAKINIPVVWTLHDCWPFTGHCSYFDRYNCMKWKSGCNHCPNIKGYPKSLFWDKSEKNYNRKRILFNMPENMTIVAPCVWMKENIEHSFLRKYPVDIINNGVDLNIFKPVDGENVRSKLGIPKGKIIILGVASTWDKRKGLDDFVELNNLLDHNLFQIVLIGLNKKQISSLDSSIIALERTESIEQLAEFYSMADVFVNPTYVDNFPTTNIEALACGTPIITYRTGGSPEAIDSDTGFVVNKGDIISLKNCIEFFAEEKNDYTSKCRDRARSNYDMNDRFMDYIKLFNELIDKI